MQTKDDMFRASLPVVLTVAETVRENAEMVTLYLDAPPAQETAAQGLDLAAFAPGQFFMVWLPRVGEKPYTASHWDGPACSAEATPAAKPGRLGITVHRRGPFSTALFCVGPGAKVGLRGPFGRGFWDVDRYAGSDRVALIGGGCGMAVLAPLAVRMPHAHLVQGARTAGVLLYQQKFPDQVIFTDDGSAGRHGFPTEWLEEQAQARALDAVYTCGPEEMMARVAEVCRREGIACQVSMERYMKCGVGVCGQCECDGLRVCEEGPTFDLADLERMPSFGVYWRDGMGRRVPLEEKDYCSSGPRPADK